MPEKCRDRGIAGMRGIFWALAVPGFWALAVPGGFDAGAFTGVGEGVWGFWGAMLGVEGLKCLSVFVSVLADKLCCIASRIK